MNKVETIRKKKDFEIVFKHGKRKTEGPISIIFKRKEEDNISRVAFIISKNIKGAVKKNKIKRRLREIYRSIKIKKGNDILILAYPGAEELDFWQLKENVVKLIPNNALSIKSEKMSINHTASCPKKSIRGNLNTLNSSFPH